MHFTVFPFVRRTGVILFSLFIGAQALASQAGWRQLNVPGVMPSDAPITVALYYPTQAPERQIPMGPFTVNVAIQSAPEASVKGLIVISHGTGSTELAHTSLAQALAQQGYLVAALRHPGDNWQDRSLLQTSLAHYLTQRPQQVSRVIDALLKDPQWADRIAKDAKGPRIGVLGHSAGGYTALALAGAQPDPARMVAHCNSHRAEDLINCGVGRDMPQGSATAVVPPLLDQRVRAAVVLAPMGAAFSAPSLAAIRIPMAIYDAELDRFLVPRFHADWVAKNVPTAQRHQIPNAWHFAFMDAASMPIGSEDGDISADPPGFDRQAFLKQLGRELPAFFDKAFQ